MGTKGKKAFFRKFKPEIAKKNSRKELKKGKQRKMDGVHLYDV